MEQSRRRERGRRTGSASAVHTHEIRRESVVCSVDIVLEKMRVAIIGGGLSGLSTALIFKHLLPKYHIKLFEKSSRICSPSSLYLGLWNPTYKIFHDLNLYEEIKPMIQPIRLFQYYNQSSQLLFESSSLNISPSTFHTPFHSNLFSDHPSFGYINQDILIQYLYEVIFTIVWT